MADVEKSTFAGVASGRRYPGKCFEKALEFTLKNRQVPGLHLVHGTILKGFRLDHAWIELPGDVVFDPVDQQFYVWHEYMSELAAFGEVYYHPREAALRALALNHHGPWDKTEEDVVGENSRPMLMRLVQVLSTVDQP
jgi:hypothetical protein